MGKKFRNKDLAARLGVSGTLVSLVLNNKADQHGIRKETQEKVISLARQMGYFQPYADRNAVAPVEEKPGILGMLVPAMNDPFVVQIAPFLQKAFTGIGVGFSVVTRDPDDTRYDRLVSAFRKFYSGLILVGNAADENTIRTLRAADYPFIILEGHEKNLRLNSVTTDTLAGTGMMTDHIEHLGYKNILIISDAGTDGQMDQDISYLREAVSLRASMNSPVILSVDNHNSEESLRAVQLEKYLRPPYRADIMIIMKSNLLYPIMKFLRDKKYRVPQDVAVVCMEEGAGFDIMYSPVTCLRKPYENISVKVANILWSEVRNSGKGKFKRQVNLAPELIVRNSCGTV